MGIRLVVGLGNPGPEYAQTRHNIGMMVVDELAERLGAHYWKHACGCQMAQVACDAAPDGTLVLAKPESFMNLSGGPVKHAMSELGITPEELLVVHDELDVAAGQVRVKAGGGHNGHNGLRSIVEKTGTRDFARIRMGIGRPPGRMDPARYVLAPLRPGDLADLLVEVVQGADAALYVVEHGVAAAVRHYGSK